MSPPRLLLVLLVALVASVGVFALAQSEHPDSEPNRPRQGKGWGSMVKRGLAEADESGRPVKGTLASSFGATESVSTSMRRRIGRSLGDPRPLHLRFSSAQAVTTSGGVALWLIEGRGVTCLVDDATAALGCDTTANANRRGIYIATYWLSDPQTAKRTSFRVVGVAPEGWDSVPATVGGRPLSIPVTAHTFERHANVPIRLQLRA